MIKTPFLWKERILQTPAINQASKTEQHTSTFGTKINLQYLFFT